MKLALSVYRVDGGCMDRRVDRAIELMRAERARVWKVEELATAVNLSANQLRYLFARHVGASPKCFELRERLV